MDVPGDEDGANSHCELRLEVAIVDLNEGGVFL